MCYPMINCHHCHHHSPAGHSCLFTGADSYLQVLYKVQSCRNWEKRRGGRGEGKGEEEKEEEVYMKRWVGMREVGSNKVNDPTYIWKLEIEEIPLN